MAPVGGDRWLGINRGQQNQVAELGIQMNAALMAVLTDCERLLVAETEPTEIAGLDEDAAVALETSSRRACDKYTGQYRRTVDRTFRTPVTEKRRASTLAHGARRQAKRDAR